ncbi:MAG: hypothetical protein FVQ83_14960 [Chloroflexi bacterium]|nr:hypothetical protein [Chloroflexota bacterium]
MKKYSSLNNFLNSIRSDVVEKTITFDEIRTILDSNLPKSAYVHRAWWANPSSPKQHPHAQSWLAAGWQVDEVDQHDEYVRFRRIGRSEIRQKKKKIISENSLNPAKGKQFQIFAAKLLSKRFSIDFHLESPKFIGNPPKEHKFDLASSDMKYVGECKNYSWTKTGNVPSAKMGFTNEAVFYLSFLPDDKYRFVVMRKDVHPKRDETLAEYYFRTNRHLLQGVHILEIDLEKNTCREVSGDIVLPINN